MDAKAEVFYGYRQRVRRPYGDDKDGLGRSQALERLRIDFARSWDTFFLVIEESGQRFDWNRGAQPLGMTLLSQPVPPEWKERLRQACAVLGESWDEDQVGWTVVCDWR